MVINFTYTYFERVGRFPDGRKNQNDVNVFYKKHPFYLRNDRKQVRQKISKGCETDYCLLFIVYDLEIGFRFTWYFNYGFKQTKIESFREKCIFS